jgi:hypothetical protein
MSKFTPEYIDHIYRMKAKYERFLCENYPNSKWNFNWNSIELKYESREHAWQFHCFRSGYLMGSREAITDIKEATS